MARRTNIHRVKISEIEKALAVATVKGSQELVDSLLTACEILSIPVDLSRVKEQVGEFQNLLDLLGSPNE